MYGLLWGFKSFNEEDGGGVGGGGRIQKSKYCTHEEGRGRRTWCLASVTPFLLPMKKLISCDKNALDYHQAIHRIACSKFHVKQVENERDI
jgi:hypothetical protein